MLSFVRRVLGRGMFNLFFLIPLVIILEIPVFMAGAGLATYLVYSRNLPEIPELATYQPRTVSTFYSDNDTVIGVFFKQKRFVVDLEEIPPHVRNAFLAAEDSRFFEHSGVDWHRVAGATVQNLKAMRIVSGASTITMQVIRNLFLTKARKLSRKINEILLAPKVEELWGKKKILYIYLNEIYLGEGCYGVEAASRGYFGKTSKDLTIAEAALIAGLVASPARYNPFKSEKLARRRQMTVLGRMRGKGFIDDAAYNTAVEQKLVIKRNETQPIDLVPDFTEEVRRYIVRKYGEDKLYNEGLKVFTTCRVDYQDMAHKALERGLKEIKARQKNLAILRTIPYDKISERLARRSTPDLKEQKVYQGVVVKVVRRKQEVDLHVALSKRLKGRVRLPRSKAKPYRVGQVLALRFDKFVEETPFFTPDNDPKLQGALVCIENRTGYVRALLGGSSKERFRFNRATQAKRPPGSAFKPVIYAVALEQKSYSPATILVDEPVEIELENKDEELWSPKNAGGDFLGPISMRSALELSRNICTIKLLMDVGFDPVISMARKMGIKAGLGRNLSLSLGTSEMSLFELTSAYTVFPNSGVYVEPVLVKRIEDRFGNVLEDNTDLTVLTSAEIPHPVPREEFKEYVADQLQEQDLDDENDAQPAPSSDETGAPSEDSPENEKPPSSRTVQAAMSPQTAYIMTSLLQGVVRSGTGARMRRILKRKDLAGKTGTTNNAEDTWFVGFSPKFTAGVWIGYDERRPLGRGEGGGRAALPVWGYFMKDILKGVRAKEFPVPPGIAFEQMSTYVGNRKEGYFPGEVTEPVYNRFAGLTLVMSPLDPPESLQDYRPQGEEYSQEMQGYPPGDPYQQDTSTGVYPGQPAHATPVHPMDGRNLFPQQSTRPQRVPPQAHAPGPPREGRWNQQAAPRQPATEHYRPQPAPPPRPEYQTQDGSRAEGDEQRPQDFELPQLPDFDSQPGVAPYYPRNR
jgi:penicillin-binding protein 1A